MITNLNLFIRLGVSILLFVNNILIISKRQQVDTAKAKILKYKKGKDLKAIDIFVRFQIEHNQKERIIKIY